MSKKLAITILSTAAIAGSLGFIGACKTNAATPAQPSVVAATNTTNAKTELGGSLIDETVYVFAKTDGSVRKTISSDWTKNSLGLDEYKKTEGKDETPIKLKITYKLDGQEISAKDLKGKSGKVEIEYKYENTNRDKGLFVPYAVMAGLMLDNNNFKNVEVKNGKLVNDGDRTIIASVLFPGLEENLGIRNYDIPDTLKITADATDFRLGMTMSVATSEIFSQLDTSSLDSLSGLSGQLGKLENGMDQLISGSSALYNGLSELNDKSGALVDGIKQLSTGATSLKDGLASIKNGATDLNSGLAQLTQNNDSLTGGAAQVKAGVFQLASSKLAGDLTAGGAPAAIIALANLTEANYTENLSTITTQTGVNTDSLKGLLDGVVGLNAGLARYTSSASLIASKTPALAEGATQAYAGAEKLENGLNTLSSKTPTLLDGIAKLKQGSSDLASGLNTFNAQGVEKLISAGNSLDSISTKLKATVNLAKNQKPVKYIYRTDEIK